jgi:hypothetical protein
MMVVPGGMVLVGKGNILSYVHGSNNLIYGILFHPFKLLQGGGFLWHEFLWLNSFS